MDNQFSNDQTQQQPANQQAETQSAGGEIIEQQPAQQEQTEKTFTQADVNNIVAREVKKTQEKLLRELGIEDFKTAKEGLQKFHEWQESQKTEAQRQAERLQKLESDHQAVVSENEALKAQLAALKMGVRPDSAQDVVILARAMVNDEVDIEQAIKQVLDKYPHFKTQHEQSDEKQENKPYFSKGQHNKEAKMDDFAKILLGGMNNG